MCMSRVVEARKKDRKALIYLRNATCALQNDPTAAVATAGRGACMRVRMDVWRHAHAPLVSASMTPFFSKYRRNSSFFESGAYIIHVCVCRGLRGVGGVVVVVIGTCGGMVVWMEHEGQRRRTDYLTAASHTHTRARALTWHRRQTHRIAHPPSCCAATATGVLVVAAAGEACVEARGVLSMARMSGFSQRPCGRGRIESTPAVGQPKGHGWWL